MGSLFRGIAVTYVVVILTCVLFNSSSPLGKMACTRLLALCLMMLAARYVIAESDADAESDGFYGYSGGAAVLRSYPAYRRPYYSPHAYRRPYGAYHAPARAPAYAGPLRGVPAVPVAHVETYGGVEPVAAPAAIPAAYVGSFNELLAPVKADVPAPAPYSLPAPGSVAISAPAPAPYSTHAVQAVPAAATSSQYHAQDEFGNVSYGYKNPNSAKDEKRDAYGNAVGAYSYIDATGVPKQLSYVADDFGFRVTGSHGLGVAPTPPH